MRVLLIGASGLIGSAVRARLRLRGASVVALSRSRPRDLADSEAWRPGDLRSLTKAESWAAYLSGVDAVVNCAGVLQDGAHDSTAAVQRAAPAALFDACESAGIRRVVHVSALGAGEAGVSAFSQTKHEAEEDLRRRDLDWVILRPAVVFGETAYGGSALIRALATLPVLPRLAHAAKIQIVQLHDVAETAAMLATSSAPAKLVFELTHPHAYTLEEVIARTRRWLGFPAARLVRLPDWLMALGYCFGDLLGQMGWRPAVRTTAQREMTRGAIGDPASWIAFLGRVPQSLDERFAAAPASVQERWFARLYLLKPFVIGGFAVFWVATGVISLGPGYDAGVQIMREAGAGAFSAPIVIGGAIADLILGFAMMFRRSARPALLAGIALSLAYVAAGSFLTPQLWADPLGAMLKILPILLLNFVALAIVDDR